jgi:NAD+ synthase
LVARELRIKTIQIPIGPVLRSFGKLSAGRLSRANLSARVRMAMLYSLARDRKGLVVGTGDKSEFLLGYFTKYGDGGADLFPTGGIYKTDVRLLASHLGIPGEIISKPSSPALWAGHTAEGELGFSYETADGILRAVEKGAKKKELFRRFAKRDVLSVLSRMEKNRHKLLPAPVCRL